MTSLLYFFIFIMAITTTIQGYSGKELDEKWNEFQKKFAKSYKSETETTKRQRVFTKNLLEIDAHNRMRTMRNQSHTRGLNNFSDWTSEEFLNYVNRNSFSRHTNEMQFFSLGNFTPPDSVDWRLQAAVSEVKNQGHCGSCWSFSVTGALEGQAKLHLDMQISLSEQNLVDCCTSTYQNHGCNGGNIDSTFLCVKDHGIEKKLDYPYVAKNGECKQKSSELFVSDFQAIEPTEENLKRAVAATGPIAVAIEATQELQLYGGGILFDRTCYRHLNHAVLVVGYGVENDEDYWLIKNSWGPSWGEQGYFRLARNRYDNCGIALSAYFASVRKNGKR